MIPLASAPAGDRAHGASRIAARHSAGTRADGGADRRNFPLHARGIRDNVEENISGQKGQVALKIYGEDLDQLVAAAEKARDVIAKVPGAVDVGITQSGSSPQISLKLDRNALARFDLDWSTCKTTWRPRWAATSPVKSGTASAAST